MIYQICMQNPKLHWSFTPNSGTLSRSTCVCVWGAGLGKDGNTPFFYWNSEEMDVQCHIQLWHRNVNDDEDSDEGGQDNDDDVVGDDGDY